MRRHARALGLVAAFAAAVPSAGYAQQLGAETSAIEFWRAVGDTTLERLVARALDANRDLRAVEARVREASADRTSAALDLGPAITASAGYSRQRLASATFPGLGGTLPDQDVWDAGLRMSWELDVFGRLRSSLDGRDAMLESAREDVRDVRVLIAASVARAYYDLRGAEDRLDVARRNAENQRRTLLLTQDRLELGRGNALDTERAQAQLSSTLAGIPALEAEVDAARNRIAVLLGGAPGSIDVASLTDLEPIELPAQLDVANAESIVRDRPDVRSAEQRLAASGAFVGAAKADYLPRLSIDGVAGYTASAFDALGNSGTPRYAVGPVISWPLLDLGRVKSRVDAARAGEAHAAAVYEQAVLSAREEITTSLTTYSRSIERLGHLADAAAASERATELARLRFEEGATDFLEVLDAERTLLEAQDRLAAGRTDATHRLVAVYRALGGAGIGSVDR